MARRGEAVPRTWTLLVAGSACLLVPGVALPLSLDGVGSNAHSSEPASRLSNAAPVTSDARAARKPRFGRVIFTRTAVLDEPDETGQLTLSIEGRIPRKGVRTVNATLRFRGTITCMSPGQCSACPGVVLIETAVGNVRSRRTASPFRVTPQSNGTYDLSLASSVSVERQRMEFTGDGCDTSTISTTEVWTFAAASAREIRGRTITRLSGSVGRSFQAPPGGHVCGLPNGWAFTTCTERLAWKLG
jgi:hypothetical protein